MINKTKHLSQATPVDTLTHLQATVTMEDLLTILTADIMAALDTLSTMEILDIMAILATLVIPDIPVILATLLTPLDTIPHIMDTMEEEDIHTLLKTNNQHHLAQVSLKSKLLRLIKLIMRRPLRNI